MSIKSGNFTTDTLFDIRTTDILTLDLAGIDRVDSDGFVTARDNGGSTWLATGSTGAAGTFDLDNGRLYDATGKEFEIQPTNPNPRLFGAIGDGVTDDIDAINSSVVFFKNALRFIKGNYLISSSIILTGANSSIIGDGSATITLDAAVNNDVIQVNSGTNVHISGITLDGNRTNQGATSRGVHITGTSADIFIDNCLIRNMFSEGITADVVNNGLFITNTRIQSLGRSGILFQSTATGSDRSTFIDDVSIVDPNENGDASISAIVISGTVHLSNIRIDTTNGNPITGIRFLGDADPTKGAHGSTLNGFSLFHDGLTADTEGVRMESTNLSVSNGFISGFETGIFHQPTAGPDDNVVTSVHVSGGLAGAGASFTAKSTSDGTNFTGCTSLKAPLIGFRVEGAANILFSGCVARESVADGFRVDTLSTNIILESCLAIDCVTGARLSLDSDGTSFDGCQFDTNTTGINVVAGTLNTFSTGCRFIDNTTAILIGSGALSTIVWDGQFKGNAADITGADEELILQGHQLRTVASATTLTVTPTDVLLSVTGGTTVDFMTGGTPGQKITILWATSGATFDIRDNRAGVGAIRMNGASDVTTFTGADTKTLICIANLDWIEIGDSNNN